MLYVGISQYGRGVFTAADIPAGLMVEACPTLLVPKLPDRPFTDLECQLRRYAFSWSEELDAIALGLGSIYNHSHSPNLKVAADRKNGTIQFFAARLIHAGEELVSSYGFDPRFQAFTKEVEIKIDLLRRKARAAAEPLETPSAGLEDLTYETIFKSVME